MGRFGVTSFAVFLPGCPGEVELLIGLASAAGAAFFHRFAFADGDLVVLLALLLQRCDRFALPPPHRVAPPGEGSGGHTAVSWNGAGPVCRPSICCYEMPNI